MRVNGRHAAGIDACHSSRPTTTGAPRARHGC